MAQAKGFKSAPQVRDLPREAMIGVTCCACGKGWGESVRALVEEHRMGAQFVDLLEWETRCACGGTVSFDYAGKPVAKPAPVMSAQRPKLAPVIPFPVKAVVKRRSYSPQYALPQMALPLAMPAMKSGRGRVPMGRV